MLIQGPYRPSLIGMPSAAVRRRAIAGHAEPDRSGRVPILKPRFKRSGSYPTTGEANCNEYQEQRNAFSLATRSVTTFAAILANSALHLVGLCQLREI